MFSELLKALTRYDVILEPERDVPEWWAGAPSIVRTPEGGFYLACRMREGDSLKGRRGYEVRLLKSADGCHFETIHRIRREDAGVPGFERPALVRDPATGLFRLYLCAGLDAGWAILRLEDAASPAEFDAATARVVLAANASDARLAHVRGYKDPFVFRAQGEWHMFVIGYDSIERAYHFVSEDGEAWRPASAAPVLPNAGWHDFFTRPACVLQRQDGYLLVYEGSHTAWTDPVYNIATGLAFSADLEQYEDLTPQAPLLTSTTPGAYHTWRYSHWLSVGDEVWAYYEAARPNNTNEIRRGVIPAAGSFR